MAQYLVLLLVVLTFSYRNSFAEDQSLKNRIKIKKHSKIRASETVDTEQLSSEKFAILSEKRRSLIFDIKKFLRESRSQDQKTELNLRLGGLYMEDYYAGLAKAQQQFEKDTLEYNAKKKEKSKKAPTLDNTEALASLDKARTIYKDLATRNPNHPRRDEMLYFMATAALDRGLTNEAMENLKQLSERYPKSKYVNDSLIQLGDYHFENNRFPVAEGYYDKVISRKSKNLISYAIYKKGWCAYNLQKPQEALKHFKWVIQNEDSEEIKRSNVRVRNEALRDITLPFVDLKLTSESIAFFKEQGEPHNRRGIETMAGLYAEQGDHKNAITLNELLLEMDPNHAKNPEYEVAIIHSLKQTNQRDKAVSRLFSRLPAYLENSSWYEINSGNPEIVKNASKSFEEVARVFALEVHAEGQRTKNDALYNTAKNLYQRYLEAFPRTVHAAQIRFYFAEILYKQEKYLAAADNYYIVYKEPNAGNLKFDSIRHTLNALDKEMNLERRKAGLSEISAKTTSKLKDEEDAVLEQTAYSPVEQKFITVAEEYLTKYPKGEEAPTVLYQQAYIQYIHYDFPGAYKSFWNLVQQYPSHSTAYASAYLIMDVLNRKKDYTKLVLACQKFLATSSFTEPSFKTKVADILRHSELKKIEIVEAKGLHKDAADGYVEYTKAYGPQDEALFEKALFNAAVNYQKAGLVIAAVEVQEKFLRRFPKSTLRENMLLQVAKTYENMANFEKSANYFEAFCNDYPRNPQVKSALRLAGLYYWGSGNAKKGEAIMKQYIASYPNDSKLVEKDLLDLYASQGGNDRLITYYLSDRARKGIAISQYLIDTMKVAELQSKASGKSQTVLMEEAYATALKYRKDLTTTPRGVEALSKVFFAAANQKEDAFYRIKLALPQRQLELNLQRKLALMKELEKEYAHVASLGGGEWGLGSIYKTAAIYRHMAQDVAEAPVPADLSAEQLDLYRAEIQKQMVKPFKEKALALSQQCMDKAQEHNVMSSWTAQCYTLAGELEPERFPLARTFYLPPVQVATMTPVKEESKTPIGNYKTYLYPYFSTGLFGQGSQERTLASLSPISLPTLYQSTRNKVVGLGAQPVATNFRALQDERKSILGKAYDSERPSDLRKPTFAFLQLMRFQNPQRAVTATLEAISKDPNNIALHNLLALSYLESNNYPAAKVTWLSLVAQGRKNSAIWNNLGVVAYLEGNEEQAIEYFKEAIATEPSKEAFTNLGSIALKYRNGFEAKQHFEKAIAVEKEDVIANVSLGVAKIQNRELDSAKNELIDSAKKFRADPYARLSLSYFLIDVDKENEVARQILSDYMHQQALEGDIQFREALQESKNVGVNGTAGGEGLPSLSQ